MCGEVDTCPTSHRLLVELIVARHIVRDVSDRDDELLSSVGQIDEGNRIVKVSGVFAIDRHERDIAKIEPRLCLCFTWGLCDLFGLDEHIRRKGFDLKNRRATNDLPLDAFGFFEDRFDLRDRHRRIMRRPIQSGDHPIFELCVISFADGHPRITFVFGDKVRHSIDLADGPDQAPGERRLDHRDLTGRAALSIFVLLGDNFVTVKRAIEVTTWDVQTPTIFELDAAITVGVDLQDTLYDFALICVSEGRFARRRRTRLLVEHKAATTELLHVAVFGLVLEIASELPLVFLVKLQYTRKLTDTNRSSPCLFEIRPDLLFDERRQIGLIIGSNPPRSLWFG